MAMNDMESQLFNMQIDGEFDKVDRFVTREHDRYKAYGIVRPFGDDYPQPRRRPSFSNFGSESRPKANADSSGRLFVNQAEKPDRNTVSTETVDFLLQRINRYFSLIKKMHFRLTRQEKELQHQRHKRFEADDARDHFHHRCLRYHDLMHGLLTTIAGPLVDMGLLMPSESECLTSLASVAESKITLELDKIEQLIWVLATLGLDKRLEKERAKAAAVRDELRQMDEYTKIIQKASDKALYGKKEMGRRATVGPRLLDLDDVKLFDDTEGSASKSKPLRPDEQLRVEASQALEGLQQALQRAKTLRPYISPAVG